MSISQITFIDSQIPDYQTLLAGLPIDATLYTINANSDGLQQIADILSTHQDIGSIQIFSHGAAGSLQLGNSTITQANLANHSQALATIGNALTATGDILLYGCNVAQGEAGQQFIQQLSQLTNADVTASTDLTGAANKGGDWILEAQTGIIETATIASDTYQDTLSITQTSQFNFGATNASLWGAGSGTTFNYTADQLVFNVLDNGIHTSGSPSVSTLGASIGLDYSLDVAPITFGFPLTFGLSGGIFNLNYPISATIAKPTTVLAGDTYSVATSGGMPSNPTMTIGGPGVTAELSAILKTNISTYLGLNYSGIPFVDNGTMDLIGNNHVPTNVPIDLNYSIFSFDTAAQTQQVKNNNGTWTENTLGGSKVYRNPTISIGFQADVNGLNGDATTTQDSSGYTDLVAIVHQDTPMLSITADIDDMLGQLLEFFPATKPQGLLVRQLDEQIRQKLSILGVDLDTEIDFSALSINATLGISPALRVRFNTTDLLVTLTQSGTGETHTGHLGDTFQFTAPSSTSAPLNITASYQLQGTVTTEVGLIFQGNIEYKVLGLEGTLFGLNIPKFIPSLIGTDNYLISDSVPNDNRLGEGVYIPSPSYNVQYTAGQSTFNIAYGAITDSITSVANAQLSSLAVQILGADTITSLGNAIVNEGNSSTKTITFRVTRSGDLNTALDANYNWTFGVDVDAIDFGGILPAVGVLHFNSGEYSQDINIVISGDTTAEIDEILTFNLTAGIRVVNATSTLTLYSDDLYKVTGTGLLFGTSRDDLVIATGTATVYALGGNDIIDASKGSTIQAGSGNDSILVRGNAVISGGAGTDSLSIDLSGSYQLFWAGYGAADNYISSAVDYSNMVDIQSVLNNAVKLNVNNVIFDSIENLSLIASDNDDLLIVQGNGNYDGKGGTDKIYADWSNATNAIHISDSTTAQYINGSTIANIERWAVKTGSGDDVIIIPNSNYSYEVPADGGIYYDNEIESWDGNDTININGNYSRVDSGAGNDTINIGGGRVDSGAGNDTILVHGEAVISGGTGTDSLSIDLSGGGGGVFYSGYDAAGNYISSAMYYFSMVGIQAVLNYAVKLSVGGVIFDGIENLSLTGGDGDDLFIVQDNGNYDGKGGIDTLYADWSNTTQAIYISNSTTAQSINGSTITNIERWLIKTGSGNDVINIINNPYDYGDEIDSGAGNDTITVRSNAVISGGTGIDSLSIDFSANYDANVFGCYWISYDAAGNEIAGAGSYSNMAEIQSALNNGVKLTLCREVTFDGIENLSLTGGDRDDLLIVQGNGNYDGKGGIDTLYADWSNTTQAIYISNSTTAQSINDSTVTNIERWFVKTGSGDDVITTATGSYNDEIYSGAGNDRIQAGGGNDRIWAGTERDTAIFSGAYTDYQFDQIADGIKVTDLRVGDGDGVDELYEIETLQFLDMAVDVLNIHFNTAPTDLTISANSINENVAANSIVGTLTSTDSDAANTFTYSLVAGGADNAAFTIVDDKLQINVSPIFVTQASYNLMVRTTDQGGLFYDKALTININDVSLLPVISLSTLQSTITEGDSGTKTITMTATLSAAATSAITVNYATLDTNATAGSDYVAASGILTFAAGETTKTFDIVINGDTIYEDNEAFFINLSSPSGAVLAINGGASAIVTITNDDASPLPVIGLSTLQSTITEGDSGTKTITMTATLSAAATSAITVNYATSDANAAASSDYVAASGILTFAAGETTKTFDIVINGDATYEDNEAFFINLSSPSGAVLAINGGASAIVTITNDDASPLPVISLFPTFPAITEGNSGTKTITMTATLSAAATSAITVNYATLDANATAGSDYVAASGILTFAAGETTKTFDIVINGDTIYEDNEAFFINLSSPSGAVLAINGGASAIVTITNDDNNLAPTNLAISATSINENVAANSLIGTLTSTDPDAANTFTYSLAAGGADNAAFTIVGNQLQINASPNFEAKAVYNLMVRTTDQGGLTYDKALNININNVNEAPINLTISATSINENVAANSVVGTLTSADPDAANTFTYSLAAGGADNAAFTIVGNQLQINGSPSFAAQPTYNIMVRTTDQGGLWVEKPLTIAVNNPTPTPTPTPTPVPTVPTATPTSLGNSYTVNSLTDVITEQAGKGWDVITSNVDNYTLPDNVEVLLFGTGVITGLGNAQNNYLLGNSVDNTINGGRGNDVMAGYAGHDTYFVDSTNINNDWTVDNMMGDIVVENADEGTDTVNSSVSYSLRDNIENLVLTGNAIVGFGNALNNTITGNAADNMLGGGAGNDTLIGGAGNDIYFVDGVNDVTTELAGEGTDIVFSTATNYVLSANVEHLIVWGAGLNGTGNAGDNIIYGNALNNTLADGAGSDILVGGRGQDIYNLSVDNTTDTLYVAAGDSLVSSYDQANNFKLGSSTTSAVGTDNLDLSNTTIAANAIVNGVDAGTIMSHGISNGIISFANTNSFAAPPVTVTSASVLADVLGYLQSNITGGETVAFVSDGNTFVFQDGGASDTLVELVGVIATSINTTGLAANSVWIV